jgi:hypothetical protein
VVQGDRQVVLVQPPQLLEGELGLPAGVDEDEGRARLADHLIDLGHGVLGGVARPGHLPVRQQHVDHRRRAGLAQHQVGHAAGRQPAAQHVRIVHRGRQPHAPQLRRAGLQARQAERQQVPALGGVDGVDLVDDHGLQVGEVGPRALPGAEQRQLLGGGEQDVGRMQPLALTLGDAGVASAGFHAHLQPHLGDRGHEVARHVHGQGLERGDVEGVQARPGRIVHGRPAGDVDQARQEAGQGLAPAGGRDQQGVTPLARVLQHLKLMPPRPPPALIEPGGKALRQGRNLASLLRPHRRCPSRQSVLQCQGQSAFALKSSSMARADRRV